MITNLAGKRGISTLKRGGSKTAGGGKMKAASKNRRTANMRSKRPAAPKPGLKTKKGSARTNLKERARARLQAIRKRRAARRAKRGRGRLRPSGT